MNLEIQQILKRACLLTRDRSLIRSGMVDVSAANQVNGKIGLNYYASICERITFVNFGGWIPRKFLKPNQAKSSQIKPKNGLNCSHMVQNADGSV
jgi:hypothetical protein